MAKRHFIEGVGYLSYETRHVRIHVEAKRGWWLAKTPDGNPGSTFEPEFVGHNKGDVSIFRPDLAEEMGW